MFVSVLRYQAACKGSTNVTRCHYWGVKGRETGIGTCDKQLGVVMQGSDLRRVVAKPLPSLFLGFSGGSILPGLCGPASRQDFQAGRPAVMLLLPPKCLPSLPGTALTHWRLYQQIAPMLRSS